MKKNIIICLLTIMALLLPVSVIAADIVSETGMDVTFTVESQIEGESFLSINEIINQQAYNEAFNNYTILINKLLADIQRLNDKMEYKVGTTDRFMLEQAHELLAHAHLKYNTMVNGLGDTSIVKNLVATPIAGKTSISYTVRLKNPLYLIVENDKAASISVCIELDPDKPEENYSSTSIIIKKGSKFSYIENNS